MNGSITAVGSRSNLRKGKGENARWSSRLRWMSLLMLRLMEKPPRQSLLREGQPIPLSFSVYRGLMKSRAFWMSFFVPASTL